MVSMNVPLWIYHRQPVSKAQSSFGFLPLTGHSSIRPHLAIHFSSFPQHAIPVWLYRTPFARLRHCEPTQQRDIDGRWWTLPIERLRPSFCKASFRRKGLQNEHWEKTRRGVDVRYDRPLRMLPAFWQVWVKDMWGNLEFDSANISTDTLGVRALVFPFPCTHCLPHTHFHSRSDVCWWTITEIQAQARDVLVQISSTFIIIIFFTSYHSAPIKR